MRKSDEDLAIGTRQCDKSGELGGGLCFLHLTQDDF